MSDDVWATDNPDEFNQAISDEDGDQDEPLDPAMEAKFARIGNVLQGLGEGADSDMNHDEMHRLRAVQDAAERQFAKRGCSYWMRKRLFNPKYLRFYFTLAVGGQVTLCVTYFLAQEFLEESMGFLLIMMACAFLLILHHANWVSQCHYLAVL